MVLRRNPPSGAELQRRLRSAGVSSYGAEQFLKGQLVVDAQDRARIARLMAAFLATATPAVLAEVYDWPGEYAQRFDGVD